jgi:glycosyltransferase involved in cell wall biosynthesis
MTPVSATPMRICYLAAANSIHSYRWVKYFADAGHEVTWISLVGTTFERLPNVRFYQLTARPWPLALAPAVRETRRILAEVRPDVLHVHYVGTYGLLGLLSGFDPIVATPWGSDVLYGKRSWSKRPFIAGILRRARVVTCDAWHMRDEVIRLGVPARRIHIIMFGTDVQRFCKRSGAPALHAKHQLGDAPAVISLRHFEPVYDVPSLLTAVPRVLERCRQTRFTLVGRGSLEGELKALAERLGVAHAVRFVGTVREDLMPETLCSHDVYVSSSLSDAGLAASTAEAMACEVPVVVTDSGENARWIRDGDNGFLVPVRSPDVLADRIIRLLEDKALRERLGRRGRETILERNDFQAEMNKMAALYAATVAQDGRPGSGA